MRNSLVDKLYSDKVQIFISMLMLTKSPKLVNSVRYMTVLTVTTVSLFLAAVFSASAGTVFGFQAEYAPSNWTFSNNNTDGSVDTSGTPIFIRLDGGDNGSNRPGITSYTTSAAAAGTVMFDWDYSTNDHPAMDTFGYLLNDVFNKLTDDDGDNNQNGTSIFNVLAYDIFGFLIFTHDNGYGPASVKISHFAAPVPEPPSVLSLLALGGLGIGLKCSNRK